MAKDLREEMSGGVVLRKEDHRYFKQSNQMEFASVSRCIRQFKKPFDAERVSFFSARKQLKETLGRDPQHHEILAHQPIVQASWKKTNVDSIDHGNRTHDGLEVADVAMLSGKPNPPAHVRAIWEKLWFEVFSKYGTDYYPEQIVSSSVYQVAGMMDKPCFRAPGRKGIIDIYDYKTNLSKGIQFSSPYSEYFLSPFDNLEYCNYVEYCIQLSIYAVLLMSRGFSIGKLTIIDIRDVENAVYNLIPVPLMQMEAQYILEHSCKNIHNLIGNRHDAIPV